jgi:hypothetical protein
MSPSATTTRTGVQGATNAPTVVRLQQGLERKVNPATTGEKSFTEIPTLDVSRMYSEDKAERELLASQLRDAATKVGFMHIKNHGVPKDVIDAAFDEMKKFFALPIEEKMKVHQHLNKDFQGYEPLYETNVGGLKRGGK